MPWQCHNKDKKNKKKLISVNVKGTYCGPIGQKIDKSIGKTPILGVPNDPLNSTCKETYR